MARRKVKIDNLVSASVPLSSMIDVVFLLLIYFIFTQKPVIEDVYLELNLPSPNASAAFNEPPQFLRIDVCKDRRDNDEQIAAMLKAASTQDSVNKILAQERVYYYVNKASDMSAPPIEARQLEDYLSKVADAAPDTTIVLNCDSNAKHKKLIKVLDMCNRLGLKNLNLVNEVGAFHPDPPEKRNN